MGSAEESCPMVLLHHTGGARESHFDWLLAQSASSPDPEARTLLAFRVNTRPDHPAVSDFEAEEMPPHRAHYLQFEGELSGGRGRVKRAAAGRCRVHEHNNQLLIESSFGPTQRTWHGTRTGRTNTDGEPIWRFRLVPQ